MADGKIMLSASFREAIINGVHDALLVDPESEQMFAQADEMKITIHPGKVLFQFLWQGETIYEITKEIVVGFGDTISVGGIEYQCPIKLT